MRVLLALGIALAAAAQSAPAPESESVVRVDLVAADAAGRAVEGLGPGDFEVTENGVAQAIDSVRFVKVDARTAPVPGKPSTARTIPEAREQASVDDTRLLAFFLDEYHVSADAAQRVRGALTKFVDQNLGSQDMVAVVKPLDSLSAIRATRDRQAIRNAIDSFEGRLGEYEPRNAFERNFLAGTPARIDPVRAQVATSALSALVLQVGKLSDGRKTVVVVSEGLTSTGRRRGLEGLPTVDTVVRTASRYNVSIYAVDPRGRGASDAAPPEPAADQIETLRALADGTGGRVIDAGELDGQMRRIADESGQYYLVTYRSVHPLDGRFREVQVRVKRPGIAVRSRKGYWALSRHEAMAIALAGRSIEPTAPTYPPGFEVPQRISPLIRPWVGVARGEAGRMRLTFVWEPVAAVPGDRSRKGEPSRVVLQALAPDGTSLFGGTVLASGSGAPGGADSGERAVFEVPPGQLRLRMSIEDAASQVLDTDVRDIPIRDLKGPVILGSAQILRTRNEREFREFDADPDASPVATREFRRTDRLILRVPAYAPIGQPKVSARLTNRFGQPMRDLPVKVPAAAGGPFQFDLPLAPFPPGEYLIELAASSPAGQVTDRVTFRVTN